MPALFDGPGIRHWLTVTEESGTRYLLVDGDEEGAMSVASDDPVFHYLWFHRCSFILTDSPSRVLVLGAGAFTASKCLARDHPAALIDTIDIEPALESLAIRFFRLGLPPFQRINFHGVCAERFLKSAPPAYDFIFDDLFQGLQHFPKLGHGREHVHRLAKQLKPQGLCVKNLIWNPSVAGNRAACEETVAAWRTAFSWHLQIKLGNSPNAQNRLLLGGNGALKTWDHISLILSEKLPEAVVGFCQV
jgi:spermidine synthase